jgi:hypothetical protein
MTYQVGGLIEASDYNAIINSGVATVPPTPAVNNIWGVGSNDSGYGQPQLTNATVGTVISSGKWNQLLSSILNSAAHQGTAISPFVNSSPEAGELIEWEAPMYQNIRAINDNRLNANLQGPVTYTNITNSTISWSNQLSMTWTVIWPSHDRARYYFNAGGQLGLSFNHPFTDTVINDSFRRIAWTMGTIWISSPNGGTINLVGSSFNGVTQVGGIPTGSVINNNLGFYGLTSSDQTLITHSDSNTSAYYYSNSYIAIRARYNGSGIVTITAQWTEDPAGAAVVSAGSTGSLAVRPPATVFVANTWNGPTVTTSISGS